VLFAERDGTQAAGQIKALEAPKAVLEVHERKKLDFGESDPDQPA
jgi:hypothetical protein